MTTPTEFVLWLNGALGVMDDTPTPEQMAKIREKMSEAIGKITADRLLERADEQIKLDQERMEKDLKLQAMREHAKSQLAASVAQQIDALTMKTLVMGRMASEYEDKLDAYTTTLRPGMAIQMPDAPDLTLPARPTFGGIFGKKSAK